MRTIIFVFLFSLSIITPVQALTGNQVLELCNPNLKKRTVCFGYFRGIMDTMIFYDSLHKNGVLKAHFELDDDKLPWVDLCLPTTGYMDQMVKIMLKRLNGNPKILHESFVSQFRVVMEDIFPCKTE
jgi:hypothetical protein